jgi:C4-dicarboxylate-specific signal transduction histidine kinase
MAVFRDRINRAMLRVETFGIDVVPCMFISSHELEQVFFAIFQNVVHAAEGEDLAEFSIKCNLSKERLVFVFSDNFDSIPYDDPNDIFEPFSSPEGTPTANSFGLAVLKRLVLAYDGTIDAKMKDGITSLEITLPVEKL